MTDDHTKVDWLRQVVGYLEVGDEVTVYASDTDRDLTVCEPARTVEREPYRHDATVLTLEGYGTEYDLEIPFTRDAPPQLRFPSADFPEPIVTCLEVSEDSVQASLSNLDGGRDRSGADESQREPGPEEIVSDISVVEYLGGELR